MVVLIPRRELQHRNTINNLLKIRNPLTSYDTPREVNMLLSRKQSLVNLDGSKDGLIENEARHDTHKSSHQEQSKRRQAHVSKVKHVRSQRIGLQLLKVHEGVEEDVNPRGPPSAERAPPPVVVLPAELKVVEQDGDFGRRDAH